jgi:STE24 endopeptidase
LRVSLAVAGAAGASALASAALRPRSGVIEPLPVSAESYFSASEIERARRFRRPQLALLVASLAVEGGVLWALAHRSPPGRGGGRRRGRRKARRPLSTAALDGARTSLGAELATLPLAALARRRAIRAGLTTDTWGHWAGDLAKSSALGTVFAAGAAAVGAGLMRRFGRHWWLPGSALALGTSAGFLTAGPLLLDPLFNKFTVVPPGPLRDDVLELARKAGVSVGEVFEVDASRRTTAANAYVTGLGPTKRVVLYDTLLENFDRDEIRLVIAHELAHVHHRDVPRGLLFLAITAPVGLFAVAQLTEGLASGGADRDGGPPAVAALGLALGLVSAPIGLLSRRLSRRVEARADSFALALAGAPEACIAFERRIALRNLADPDPPAWMGAVLATHPTTVQRIGIAEAYAAEQQGLP